MEESVATSSFIKRFFTPEFLVSFKQPLEDTLQPHVHIYRSPTEQPEILEINNFYPFMTFQDLKTIIYLEKGQLPEFYPACQALMIPVPIGLVDVDTIQDVYHFADFAWMKPGSTLESDIYNMQNPFTRARAPDVDERFVDTRGAAKVNDFASRSRTSYESILPLFEGERPVFHLFLFKDVVKMLNPQLLQSEREWNGRIKPYFPELSPTQPVNELTAQQNLIASKRVAYVKRTVQLLNRLDVLLDGGVNLYSVALAGIKFLRLTWAERDEESPSLETLFYQLPVTPERPFLRILPSDNVAVTKLRLAGTLKIPDISDPRLLLQWAQEKNPTPDKDFLFGKVVIRKTIGTQPALYGTLRIFEEKSGDFVMMPPKQLRKLDPRSDLREFPELLLSAIADTPLSGKTPEIGEASLICGIRMPTEAKAITKNNLRKRLSAFSPLFQEIAPLPGEQPLVMLRYKAVSNFANEDRIFAFLSQLVNRRIIKGELALGELVNAIGEEFQLSETEAEEKVRKWWDSRGQMTLAVPETKDYIMTYNTGIDIGIFAQHPFYSFHIYRADSIQSLERIITALSILFSAEDDQLFTPEAITEDYVQAEEALIPITPGSLPRAGAGGPIVEAPEEAIPENSMPAEIDMGEAIGDMGDYTGMDADMMFNMGTEDVFDMGDAFEEEAQATIPPVNVASRVKQETIEPIKNIPAAQPLPAPQTQAQAARIKNENDDEDEDEDSGKKTYAKYLAKKLQEADERLFVYKSQNPAVKIKKYVTMCQATETRQPAVLNQEQYERMRDIYRDDDIAFLVFPLETDDKSELPEEGKETYTVLRYGSDPLHQNYYLCCEFFCVKDYIMVREVDFYSTRDRKGKPKIGESRPGAKDRGSCPFCHGLLIKSLKAPAKDETIIQRKVKQKSKEDKRHLWVGFLKDTFHPEGFYLPCCFTGKKELKKGERKEESSISWDKSLEDKLIRISDKQFTHIRSAAQAIPEEVEEDEEEDMVAAPAVSAASLATVPILDYAVTLAKAHRKYIVGPEKFPLKMGDTEGPQIGLLPPVLDKYFNQNPTDFVSREFNRMELKPQSEGFLRIGVENRSTYLPDSFLAAIAPFIDFRNNASEVKTRLMEVITPRIFLFLNYGNLVLEFYDPSYPNPADTELRKWVSEELQVDMTPQNQDALLRLWKSYNNFLVFIKSSSTLKEYRQFAQLLALPRLITPRGIVFIILDINEKEEVEVRCPPYGYDMDRFNDSDIGFLLHHYTGVWEPIFFTDNRPARARFEETHTYVLGFQRSVEASWPSIVRQRVREFTKRCAGPGRAEFTSQSRIDPNAMVPVARAIQLIKQDVFGVIRDSYNHVVALTYRIDSTKSFKAGLIAFPVVDDGTYVQRWVHFDWDDFPAAHMEDVIQWYRTNIEKQFTGYRGYRVLRGVKSRGTKKYVAVQLANGIYIPCSPPRDDSSKDVTSLPFVEIQEMEWSINRDIVFSDKGMPSQEQLLKAEESDMEEIFEHLRLTFSKWLESDQAGGDLRQQIEKIIFRKDLPLFEKRKRLQIHLESTVMNWMNSDISSTGEISSLLRADCRVKTQPYCTGRCVWRQGGDTNASGRCLLHVPEKARLGSREVNGPRLLFLRLIEELLRFPERRRQLLYHDVPTLVKMKNSIKLEDTWILPETSIAWYDLLRLDWVKSGMEKKLHFEEMSRAVEERQEELPQAPQQLAKEVERKEETVLPENTNLEEDLLEILGADDPKTKKLRLFRIEPVDEESPLRPYLSLFGLSPEDIGLPPNAIELTKEAIKKLVVALRVPVMQFNTQVPPPDDQYAYGLLSRQKTDTPIIFVITFEGPALLSMSEREYKSIQTDEMPSELYDLYDLRIALKV